MLIDQANFKANVPYSNSLDLGWIATMFEEAEFMYVRDVICKDLYNELNTQKLSNTLTVANAALLAKLYKPISLFIIYHSLPAIHTRIQNVGVTVPIADNGQSISSSELSVLRTHYSNTAEFYMNDVITFIKDNIADYPLYSNCNECDGVNKTFRSNIYFRW